MKCVDYVCALCKRKLHDHYNESHNEFTKAKELLELTPQSKNDETVEICDTCFHNIYLPYLERERAN